jgi:hypothetical protein
VTSEVEFATYSARIEPELDSQWNTALLIRIGRIPSHLPEPIFYMLVNDAGGKPVIRLGVYIPNDDYEFRRTAIIWHKWIVIGPVAGW